VVIVAQEEEEKTHALDIPDSRAMTGKVIKKLSERGATRWVRGGTGTQHLFQPFPSEGLRNREREKVEHKSAKAVHIGFGSPGRK